MFKAKLIKRGEQIPKHFDNFRRLFITWIARESGYISK